LCYKFYRIQIGPLVGGHLLLNKDEKVFRRDGNSIRLGIDMNGNFPLQRASLNFAFRYERDIVFGNKISIDQNTGETTLGDLVTRNPSTLQINVGFRAPISRDLELRFDFSRYKIKLDFDEETSLNPIPTKSRLVFLAGIGYRFKT